MIMLPQNLCKPIKNMKSLSTSEDNKIICVVECTIYIFIIYRVIYKVDSKASFRQK